MNDKKTKQNIVNVSDESKAKITELKKTLNVTDKEFIAALLVVLEGTDAEVIKSAVESVTIEKQKAKISARLAKIKDQLDKAKIELGETPTNEIIIGEEIEPVNEVVA